MPNSPYRSLIFCLLFLVGFLGAFAPAQGQTMYFGLGPQVTSPQLRLGIEGRGYYQLTPQLRLAGLVQYELPVLGQQPDAVRAGAQINYLLKAKEITVYPLAGLAYRHSFYRSGTTPADNYPTTETSPQALAGLGLFRREGRIGISVEYELNYLLDSEQSLPLRHLFGIYIIGPFHPKPHE
ncbi:MAG TPA: hypothetical protein DCE41_15495 [Cytophagales bacterium]|nr:hypothetical protein [Cytophagales bacterium]HAA17658.1 hypothetical protein [Cytophagales bacterium]